jgi:pimeloyl-ACP methyl ester carboxylesterase
MTAAERDVPTADGRTLRVLQDGDPHGLPVFYLHGTPGCRLLFGRQVEDAHRRGLRLIGHDRPGYGGSTRRPGRSIGDEATDVAAIADALGIDRFAVYGFSGGGAPTLACAARLPKRVVAASCLAGVAPYPAEGLDWLAGTGELNVEDFKLMLRDQAAWEAQSLKDFESMREPSPEQFTTYLSSLLSDVDRAAFTGEVAAFLLEQRREGSRPGISGGIDDSLATARPWGFELSSIRVPVQLWHGKQDKFVPFSHGEWLGAHLPRAERHLEPNEGHLSLFVNRVPSVHEWLASRF